MGGRTLHDVHSYGKLNLADIIKLSSNIGAAKVGQAVGAADLYRTLRDFGFGQVTGVDLRGEVEGMLRNWRRWREVEMANICFGQGVAVTSLQMAQAVGAIANGGVLMRPYLVKARLDRDSRLVSETRPRVVRRVMGAREARILTRMMTRVTEDDGTGPKARVEPFAVAARPAPPRRSSRAGDTPAPTTCPASWASCRPTTPGGGAGGHRHSPGNPLRRGGGRAGLRPDRPGGPARPGVYRPSDQPLMASAHPGKEPAPPRRWPPPRP